LVFADEGTPPPYNKTLQSDKIRMSLGRESAAHVLLVLRTKAVGGSRDLATIFDILDETF
jgi:hypothetical protein